MFVLVRALVYATCFVAFLLVFVPARLLERAGIARPPAMGVPEYAAATAVVAGSLVALWCVLTFVFVGRGTPAPFDPPRRLVVRGPYRFVRNPMYLGAGLALAGAAGVYHSLALLIYVGVLAAATELLVVFYEEPTLARLFGPEYEAYRREVHRWIPRVPRRPSG
jgi:protein-S-isoprenylcysteine O-methyltransferase Ste14